MTIQLKINDIDFGIGDYIKIVQSIKEGEKERTFPFEGIVIAIKGRGDNMMFTVRKIAIDGIGVEKIFPVKSPTISKITVKKKGHPRRAKLYYLRNKNAR